MQEASAVGAIRPRAKVLAGGTDLLVQMKMERVAPAP